MAMNVLTSRRGDGSVLRSVLPRRRQAGRGARRAATPITVLPLPEAGQAGGLHRRGRHVRLHARRASPPSSTPATRSRCAWRSRGTGNLANVTAPAVAGRRPLPRLRRAAGEGRGRRRAPRLRAGRHSASAPASRELPRGALQLLRSAQRAPTARSRRGPTPLTVRAAAAGQAPRSSTPASQRADSGRRREPLGRDIVYIKDAPGDLAAARPRLYQRAWFLASCSSLPVALFAALCGLCAPARAPGRRPAPGALPAGRARGAPGARRARQARAGGRRGSTTSCPRRSAAYLGAKLDLPPGAVERERVAGAARRRTAAARRCANASARSSSSSSRRATRRAQVGAAERDDRAASWPAASSTASSARAGCERRLAAGVLLALLVRRRVVRSVARADEATPQTAFFQGNQAYAAGRYARRDRAPTSRCATAGQESGALDFNLGNALFKDGQLAAPSPATSAPAGCCRAIPTCRPICTYARELAQAPRRGDAALAAARVSRSPRAPPAASWRVLASLCWWAFWVLLAARVLVPRLRLGLGRAAAAVAGVSTWLSPPASGCAWPRSSCATPPSSPQRRTRGALRAVGDRHRALPGCARHARSTSPRSATAGCRCAAPTAAAAGSRPTRSNASDEEVARRWFGSTSSAGPFDQRPSDERPGQQVRAALRVCSADPAGTEARATGLVVGCPSGVSSRAMPSGGSHLRC